MTFVYIIISGGCSWYDCREFWMPA